MIILGIESSCDETAAAVVQKIGDRVTILSNVVASSADLQAKYGGVIPEQAAREQIKSIIPVIETTLNEAFPNVIPSKARNLPRIWDPNKLGDPSLIVQDDRRKKQNDMIKKIDAIAVTYGPGLIGSLLVGVETAKTLAMVWGKPLIPINHLLGHFYANWISHPGGVTTPTFPCIGLLVSGGHTDLLLFKNHNQYEYLGGTRDDAAGECFDKCARLLGLPYPGGPNLAKLATQGDALQFDLPRPMIDSKDFDFSFSGLKTAVANLLKETHSVIPNEVRNLPPKSTGQARKIATPRQSGARNDKQEVQDDKRRAQDDNTLADLAASIEAAIVDVLVAKTIKAVQTYKVEQIIIAGGVAANQSLIRKLKVQSEKLKVKLHFPPPELCTDNAAMIAAAAFFQKPVKNPLSVQANPNLPLRQ